MLVCIAAYGRETVPYAPPLAFDSTQAVVRGPRGDSASLLLELAFTNDQRTHGLSRRTTLDSASGMLFRFDSIQSGDNGFWMWRTLIPLDIAFLDSTGVIKRVLSMEPTCPDAIYPEACPPFKPGVSYLFALEVNKGWFASHGFDVGASLTVAPLK